MNELDFNLNTILVKKGIKRKWLADKLGVTPGTVGAWCGYMRTPKKWQVVAMAQILEVEPKEIYEGYEYGD